MSAVIGLGAGIDTVEEFNRRAVIALRAVSFGQGSGESVVATFRGQVERGGVSEKMQQAIYNIVHRYRKQITDQMVVTYAGLRAKGAD